VGKQAEAYSDESRKNTMKKTRVILMFVLVTVTGLPVSGQTTGGAGTGQPGAQSNGGGAAGQSGAQGNGAGSAGVSGVQATGGAGGVQAVNAADLTRPRSAANALIGVPETTLPQSETPETLQIHVGKSLVLKSPVPLKRVSVTDPQIASAVIVNPNQVLIHGHTPGAVTLILWDEHEKMTTYDLQVGLDIGAVRDAIKQIFPAEGISVAQAGASIVLSGTVSSKAVADLAVQLAQTETKSVVNLLGVPEATGEVLLQVRFAEVDRTTMQQLGLNILSTGAANTVGTVGTQQFGAISGGQGNRVTGVIPGQNFGTSSSFTLSDLLNIFVFRPDLNLGATIRALEQRQVLQILAEPNLLALNGREASFLAGGEFPFPVVQGGVGINTVTILFKEFGVRLKFLPTINRDGTIRLHVAPEVSALDFTNSLTVSGFTIPALSTRRSETEIELKDGQSFAIAGLIDNRLTEIANKIPILGDVPIIGHLFRSRSENKTNTELLVMVTPKIVRPLPPGQVPPLPAFPKSFYNVGGKFDGKTGVTPPSKN